MHEVRGPQPHALAPGEDGEEAAVGVEVRELVVAPTCKRVRAQILTLGAATGGLAGGSSALGGPLEGWRVASKGLGPLPRRRGSALAHGCGRSGIGALPLPRAAVISTRLRVRHAVERSQP